MTTSSLPALRAYLEGEAELRAGRFQPAFDAFGRAVAEDSTFALAYYSRSIAAEWLTRWSDAVEAAERAQRHAERLSERDRALLDALLAYRRGSYTEAEERYRSIVGLYPDDVEAWFQFAEILFHYNPLRGRSFTESRTAFERTMDLGSFGPLSLVHLARVHAVAGDVEALDTAVEAFLALNPSGDRTLEMRALRGFALRDSAEQAWVMASAQSLPAAAQAITAWDVALFSGNLDGAKDVVEVMAAPNSSDDVRRVGLEWGAYLDVARGRWGSALSRVREIASFHPEVGLEIRAVLALAPDAPFARSDLTSIERALRSFDSASVPHARTPSLFFNAHDQLHPVIRLYLLGLLNARLGATEEAATLADSLSVQNVPPGAGSLAGDLALGVRAEVALAEGEAERALALLAEIRMASWYSPQLGSAFLAQAHNRFLRGEALYLVGRYDEARGWLSSLGQITPGELIYLPAALLRLASAAEQADDLEGASAAYSRFLDLWTTADPELQSRADSVRARLDSLRASSS